MSENNNMEPVTGDYVEVDGIYENEAGRELELKRGDPFPADLILGKTEWKLNEFKFDNHHEGRTDARLVPKAEDTDKMEKIVSPRGQLRRGKK